VDHHDDFVHPGFNHCDAHQGREQRRG
jgi:hypothetical protein